ncbi:hypothetical protein HK104_005300 [Borealophlyctis nickersoniae]|nr:hypothetical protein HK104_005300 [Borealophlyctis nickersoniae]
MIRKYFKPVEKEAPEASSKKRRVGDDVATSKGVTVTTETTGDQDIVVSAVEGQVVLEDTGATANVVSQKVTVTKDGVEEGVSEQQTSLTEEDVKTAKNLVAPKNLNPLLQLEYENMAPDWWKAFKSEMEKPYFLEIKRFLAKEKNPAEIYPIPTEIYSFTHCPLKKVKVVIIGQDPYHGPNQAHGLCFSVKKPERVPPSLKNIFDEITQDLGPDNFQRPDHGCLEGWSSEGTVKRLKE